VSKLLPTYPKDFKKVMAGADRRPAGAANHPKISPRFPPTRILVDFVQNQQSGARWKFFHHYHFPILHDIPIEIPFKKPKIASFLRGSLKT
jgi:hypothetical protein